MTDHLILYKTRHGATEEYARAISSKVNGSTLIPITQFNIHDIDLYERVIIGSCIYMGKIEVIDALYKEWDIYSKKPIFLFTVGLLDKDHPSSLETYESIPQEIKDHIEYIKLPGKIIKDQLSLAEKLLLKVISPKELDRTDFDAIAPILEWLDR